MRKSATRRELWEFATSRWYTLLSNLFSAGIMGEYIFSRGDYTLSFARRKKARPIIEADMMTDLNIRANYSFRMAAARRGASSLIRLWQYISIRAPDTGIESGRDSWRYRHLKSPDRPFLMNRSQYLIKSRY